MTMLHSLTYLYLLRVPLLCGAAAFLLAPLGAFPGSAARGMLEGLFDLTAGEAVWAGGAAALMAMAVWSCQALVLAYARRRLPGLEPPNPLGRLRLLTWIVTLSGPAMLAVGVGRVSGWDKALLLAGGAAALVLARRSVPSGIVMQPLAAALRHFTRWSKEGYYRHAASGALLGGHIAALQAAALFGCLYAVTGWFKFVALRYPGALPPSLPLPPALSYLLLLIGLLCWLISGIAFFFDRFRVPVLLPWVALLAVSSAGSRGDASFAAARVTPRRHLTPARIVEASRSATPIVVCASGGGIHAAAWAAKVLVELERAYPRRFSQSVRLFSGTSGGSVGGLHFVAAYEESTGAVPERRLADVCRRASSSLLDAVAWGLTGPDFLRAVSGGLAPAASLNRGWALERAIDPDSQYPHSLEEWRTGAASGARPAVVFNATVVETGARVVLGTVDFPAEAGLTTLRGMLRVDTSPVTAARLSASFPFITPAASPDAVGLPPGSRLHLVDGGYYDNYGVGAGLAFLDSATAVAANPREVLLIEIRARGSAAATTTHTPALFQWMAPLLTMMNVRDAAQRSRNDAEAGLLGRALAARGVALRRVAFEFPSTGVPLSWHLTARQQTEIDWAWQRRFAESEETAAVGRYLARKNGFK